MTQSAVWLFDSECVLCEWGVGHTLRNEIEPSIRFVSIQSEEGKALALANHIDPTNPASFLFLEDGKVLSKSDGVIALARHLKGPTRWIRFGRIFPKAIRDFLYSVIARYRYAIFGRTSACLVPKPEHRNRFVL